MNGGCDNGLLIPFDVWEDVRLTPAEKLVCGAILHSANRGGFVPTNESLAKIVGCSVSSVARAIKTLKECGYIQLESKRYIKGRFGD